MDGCVRYIDLVPTEPDPDAWLLYDSKTVRYGGYTSHDAMKIQTSWEDTVIFYSIEYRY